MPVSPALFLTTALALPGVTEGTAHGNPVLRLQGKFFCCLRDNETVLVLQMDRHHRDHLVELEPETFFLTDHYRPFAYVLVRLAMIDETRLRHLLGAAWRFKAPKRFQKDVAPPW